MKLALREAYPVDPVDPLSVSPDPGEMGQMYIGAREKYPDGMTLACATPKGKYTYEEIKAEYVIRRTAPDFSDVVFFDDFFDVTSPDSETSYKAKPGQTLDEYTLEMRPKFIIPNTRQGHFDVKLPEDRAVAGIGRFGEQSFLWDGYHMAKGYASDGRWDLVLKVIYNTEHQINEFGYPLNGSAYFYATRAQPDYFAHMVRMLADEFGPEALVRLMPALEKEHMGYWMNGKEELEALPDDGETHAYRSLVRMPDGSFLNRYWDDAEGPRLESYMEDVQVAEEALAKLTTEDLVDMISAELSHVEMAELTLDEVAELISIIREKIRAKIYKSLRLGAASGWDFSSRWLEDGRTLSTINTTDILPVDHNSLLAYNEETLAMAYVYAAEIEGYNREECLEKVAMYRHMADERTAAINKYMWDPKDKIFRDHNFIKGAQTKIVSAAMSYPLYVGIANEEQTFGVARSIKQDLLRPGGVATTTTRDSKEQWDGDNAWAPTNWATERGLARMAHILVALGTGVNVEPLLELAEEVRDNYTNGGIQVAFDEYGIVPEKHRGDDPKILAGGGEYEVVKALAMSMETWRALKKLNVRDAADHLPMGRLAVVRALGSLQA